MFFLDKSFGLIDLQSFLAVKLSSKVYIFFLFLESISLGKKTCLFIFLVLIAPSFTENDSLNFKFVALVCTQNAFLEYQNDFSHVI